MSLSTCYSEFDRHVARLRRRRRAYAPTSNTASHDNHEKINSWFSFVSHIWVAYGAPPGGPFGQPELRYNKYVKNISVTDNRVPNSQDLLSAWEARDFAY